MKSRYRKLGSLIEKVDIRNIENISYDLMGVKITKEFMPSVANINGTDMKKYKLVYEGMFAANLMHVDRDKIIPVALWQDPNPVLISPAYDVFKIIDDVELLPEYLMICFRRSDFDRNGWFLSGSSIRGNLTWDKFCDIEIPIPDLSIQRKITETISKTNHYIHLLKESENVLLDILDSHYNKIINSNDCTEVKLSEHITLTRGIEPGSDNYLSEKCEKCIEFFRVGEILSYSSDIYIRKTLAKKKTCQKSDILVSFDGTIGKVAYGRDGAYSSGLRKIDINSDNGYSSALLLAYFRSQQIQETLLKYATGTTILHASSAIPNLKIKYDLDLFNKYNYLGEPIFETLLNITEKINKLERFEKIFIKKLTTI